MYGKSLQKNWKQNFANTQIVENPEMLNKIEEMVQKEAQTKLTLNVPDSATPIRKEPIKTINATTPTNKQIEVRLPDGKRRITPMLLTTIPTETTLDVPSVTPKADTLSSSSPTKSKIVVEKVQEMQPKNLFNPTPIKQTAKAMERPQMTHSTDKIPGFRLNSVACKDVPGDAPVVCFINQLDPLRLQPGITVSRICHQVKIQVSF